MKIFYVGGGFETMDSLIESGNRNVMLTYFSFYGQKEKRNFYEILQGFPRKRKISESWQKYLKHFDEIMIDSGAFTFQIKSGIYYRKSQKINIIRTKEIDKFTENYGKWLAENKSYYNYFVEMDIDKVVGLKKVEEYRKYLERCAGKQCMPVWHENRGIEYWKNMITDYKFVAVGGVAAKEMVSPERKISYLIKLAREKDCKVHGMGYTKHRFLNFLPYDTVDSSTWLGGGKYGKYHLFLGKKMRSIQLKNHGLKTKSIHRRTFDFMNAQSWKGYEDYLEKYWARQKESDA